MKEPCNHEFLNPKMLCQDDMGVYFACANCGQTIMIDTLDWIDMQRAEQHEDDDYDFERDYEENIQ